MPNEENPAEGVGVTQTYKDATEKYDATHGAYRCNVPHDGEVVGLPNAAPAAANPSPFKLGPT